MAQSQPRNAIDDAIDLIAAHYPLNGVDGEKFAWMDDLQILLEARAAVITAGVPNDTRAIEPAAVEPEAIRTPSAPPTLMSTVHPLFPGTR